MRERERAHTTNISLLHRQEMVQDMHFKFTSKSNNSRELIREIMKLARLQTQHFSLENRHIKREKMLNSISGSISTEKVQLNHHW